MRIGIIFSLLVSRRRLFGVSLGQFLGKKTPVRSQFGNVLLDSMLFWPGGKSLTLCLLVYMDDKEQNNV
jgi:hypothetical protein